MKKKINLSFIKNYKIDIVELLEQLQDNKINDLKNRIINTKRKKGKVYIFGNGGSASTANHVAVDLTKNAKIKSISVSNDNLISCFSNDYSFDDWMAKYANYFVEKNDFIILLSASGNSKNILNLAKYCKKKLIPFFSLTGLKKNNRLNNISKNKIWIKSNSYNQIELIHFTILAIVIDLIIGKKSYGTNL
jgi:Phosphoheptose isomerase|tara:strand:- start:3701 stop:4273 length:573 start_codon:yes stop_codon:yes gene_type:complete